MTTATRKPLVKPLISVTPISLPLEHLCVLCEQTTLVPVTWQNGTSVCCRRCFRSHRKQA